MDSVLDLPWDVLTRGVLAHLSIRDLQAVNVAFTSTPTHRAQIKQLWKSYPYECPDEVGVTLDDLKWLKSVDMKPVALILQNIDASEIEFIALHFPTLRRFDICKNKDAAQVLDDSVMLSLAHGCLLLEVVCYVGACHWSNIDVIAFAQACPHLLSFTLYGCPLMPDNVVQTICSHCPHLKRLDLTSCDSLSDASLIAIADSYPHLESIHLRSYDLTDDGFLYIADRCHELQSMSVRCDEIASRGLTALWAANPNLMDVDINNNYFISDSDIAHLLQCCPLLQKLNISSCNQITEAAVIAVAGHCPQLKSLNISWCYSLSDASLIALGQHCHHLKSISVFSLVDISHEGIAAFAAGCPLLQEFYADSTSVTNAAVVALARGCRDLRKVTFHKCNLIGISAISAIAENCSLLSEFNVYGCFDVDDACLHVIAQHCRNLTKLTCSGVSEGAANYVRKVCRCKVKILTE